MHEVRCLYCSRVTGHSVGLAHLTVCNRVECTSEHGREEYREVAAGLRPWRRPLSFWIDLLGYHPMAAIDAAAARDRWDAEQARIAEYNRAHAGGVQ